MVGLNGILRIEVFGIHFDPGLNHPNVLQVWEVSSILVKDEFIGCGKLVGKLKDDNIISTLALRIFLKVNKAVDNHQRFLFAKAQG